MKSKKQTGSHNSVRYTFSKNSDKLLPVTGADFVNPESETLEGKLNEDTALDAATFDISLLRSATQLLFVVVEQIKTVIEYLGMLKSDPAVSTEKNAYLTGINHGAVIAVWRHMELLGYVVEAATSAKTLPGKKKRIRVKKT